MLFIIVLLGIVSEAVADTSCARDSLGNYWFGPSCRFLCHCFDRRQCDITTGRCSSFGCERGYFGPGCQYFSIAYQQQTTHSGSSSSSSAVDGYMSTYSLTRTTLNPTWSVELQHPAWIVWVDVLVPANHGTRAIAMTTTNRDTTMPCDATNAWITTTTLRMTCMNVVNATTITLVGTNTTESQLGLTEVYVYGGRNIALRGDTSQSSVYDIYNSSLAVDGGISTRFLDRSCTHTAVTSCTGTGTTDPNWLVRLGQDYQMYRVDVYNRGTTGERLNNFRIRLGKAGISGLKRVYQDTAGTAAEVTSVQMPASRTANRLEVTLSGDCKILTLCEVQVFGDCLDYIYGLACNFACSCRDRAEVCNKVDGSCLSGCVDGFTGVDCKQECPVGRYGRYCSNNCSSNCVDGDCLHVDGTCKCVPGWMGDRCTIGCELGTYGHECSNRCSTCRDIMCHPGNGTCIMGCQRGRTGTQCTKECDTGTFGWGCNETCAVNCAEQRCHGDTGDCASCIDGWEGTMCDRVKQTNMTTVAVVVVVVLLLLIAVAVVAVVVYRRKRRQKHPDVVPSNDTMLFLPQEEKIVYENAVISPVNVDKDLDTSEETHEDNNVTMETDVETHVIIDKAKLIIDVTPRAEDHVTVEADDSLVYSNKSVTDASHVLDVTDLPDHMTAWRGDSKFFLEEYKSLPRDLRTDIPHAIGMKEENRKKNRYKNICAYDHSRVELPLIGGDPDSDYINACYVQGYSKDENFIASQGPTKKTMADFLRMLWELKVPIIAMLTNVMEEGKRKCEQYWDPEDDFKVQDFKVAVADTTSYAQYTVRTLHITKTSSPDPPRSVTQYHFTSWPDKSVPTSPWSLIHFRNKVMTSDREKGPIVVHCSAGVGRTGTFIALDWLMRMAEEVGHVDIYDCVERMREDRVNMVQTLDQYIFLHEALAMSALLPPPQSCDVFLHQPTIDDAAMMSEFMKLNSFIGLDSVRNTDTGGFTLKSCESMTSLADETGSQGSNDDDNDGMDYAGVVFVPGFWHRKQYLLMDTPDLTFAEEFFRWMYDLDIQTIVTLDHDDPKLWPGLNEVAEFNSCRVTCTSMETQGHTIIKTLVYQEEDLEAKLTQLTCPGWADSTNLSDSPYIVLDFIKTVKQSVTCDRPVVVQSSPSYGNGGMLCCVSAMMDQAEVDLTVAIPHVISQVRAYRPEVIRSMAEYSLCYDCVRNHLNDTHLYSNYNPNP
ncbi:receptor-type tyrosine-protein phosphatase mu-like isoform X1 [Haliotis cracherodii]|uniref:receptor-type tyrosine-protein phosphatase mu-like isoform X1 n=1 Tax=Haliotis cracherodii TaxID=6455 RepID=UPI0039EC7CA6